MNKILSTTLLVSLCLVTARADQAPVGPASMPAQPAQSVAASVPIVAKTPLPSRESVARLVSALGLKQNFDAFYNQVDSMIEMQLTRSTTGIGQTADNMAALKATRAKLMAKIKTDLSWEKLEVAYFDELSKNFTQEEINGLVSFYESPLGKAYVAKQPEIMKNSTRQIQGLIGPVMREVVMEIQKAGTDLRGKSKPVGANMTAPVIAKPSVAPAAPSSVASKPAS